MKIFCTVLFKFYFRNSVIYILCKIFCLAFTKNVQSLFSQLCEYSNYGDFDFIFLNFPFSNCFYAKLSAPGILVSWYSGILVFWYPGILVSWYPGILVSWYPWSHGILVSWYHGILVSWYPSILVFWNPSILVSWYPSILISWYPGISILVYYSRVLYRELFYLFSARLSRSLLEPVIIHIIKM